MRTRLLVPAAILLSLTLAACSPSTQAPENEDVASSAPADDFSDVSSYYPVAVGNAWEYEIVFPEPIGTVTTTETMTTVVRDGDSVRATIARTMHYENGLTDDIEDSVDYVFNDDGSLEVPYQSLPDSSGTVVTVKSGTMVWPTDEEFEAGTVKTGTIEASVEASGTTIDQSVDFSIKGAGVESVTVPAGTFDARLLEQDLTISIPSLSVDGLPISAKSWLAPGTGLVKTEIPGLFGSEPIVMTLTRFTPVE
jgi:hypothetical protein